MPSSCTARHAAGCHVRLQACTDTGGGLPQFAQERPTPVPPTHRQRSWSVIFRAEAEAQPEYVAMHFTEGGEADAAVQWWQRAGRRAFSRAAYTEAATHFTKGLDLLTSMPASVERDQRELALEVELGYALIPVRGWAATDTARAFTRAGELSSPDRRHAGAFSSAVGSRSVSFRARRPASGASSRQSSAMIVAGQDERRRRDHGGALPEWHHLVRDGQLRCRAARSGGVRSDLRDGKA